MAAFALFLFKLILVGIAAAFAWKINSRFITYLGIIRAADLLIVALVLVLLGFMFVPIFDNWAFLPLLAYLVLVALALLHEYYLASIKPDLRKWLKTATKNLLLLGSAVVILLLMTGMIEAIESGRNPFQNLLFRLFQSTL